MIVITILLYILTLGKLGIRTYVRINIKELDEMGDRAHFCCDEGTDGLPLQREVMGVWPDL